MIPTLIRLSVAFLLLGLVLYSLEKLFPAVREKPLLRKGVGTDLIYWFFTPVVTKAISKATVIIAVIPVALLLGLEPGPELAEGFGPIARQPMWLIALEMLVFGDFLGYWIHRLFHAPRLWPFHAVHHSSTGLDWLSSVRVHPVNDLLGKVLRVVILLCLGFPLNALAAYVPFLVFYALLLHANVPWSFGPLRYVIASPLFHRRHHSSEVPDKNFAGLFPIFDILFGTFYMPKGEQPSRFGVSGSPLPDSFPAQMIYPFRRTQESASSSA
ncbi:MAG: sterol desaturase family protein [Acidobacteriota bacterium]|nr:sterol desaturase family protein [Acidobacteriota bacterium]